MEALKAPSWAISEVSRKYFGYTLWQCNRNRWAKNNDLKRRGQVKKGRNLSLIHSVRFVDKDANTFWLSEEYVEPHEWIKKNMPTWLDEYNKKRDRDYIERQQKRVNGNEY